MRIGTAMPRQPRQQCPCCKYWTLAERDTHDICPVCFWQDDGQGEEDADVVRGGPNGDLSLRQAQANYARFGAAEGRFTNNVRRPKPDEIQDPT